jgi:hypothetical protein
MRVALVLCVAAACGKGSGSTAAPPPKHDAAVTAVSPTRIELAPRPLGLADLSAYQWRKRAGQPAFKSARKAEGREDWAAVVAACREALVADPTHLDAAWLLAAGLGKLGKTSELVEPLAQAVAGDFGKWGQASLELPALQSFLATPTGDAWRRRVEEDRSAYLEALANVTIVEGDGELYGLDRETSRWHRLTRTGGAVVGALPAPGARQLAYVTRQGAKGKRELAIGVIDLGTGRTTRPIPLGTLGPISVVYNAKAPIGFFVGSGSPKPTWRVVGGSTLDALPPKTARPPGRRLEVQNKTARLHGLPVAGVIADWDDQGLASAMRISSSNKVVTVPGLIDGNTVVWSADRSHLAFIAQLQPDSTCTPGAARAAAYTADAATGAVTPLWTPVIEATKIDKGLSVEWMSDRTLLVAGSDGVTIIGLDGQRSPMPGATDLVTPHPRPRCTPAPDDEPVTPDDPDPEAAAGGGSGSTMVGPP